MLVRSAGRRHQRRTSHALAASFAQLNLPWLAPAQLRWSASHAATASQRPRRSNPSTSAPQVRNLATTTDPQALSHHTSLPPTGYSIGFRNSSQDKNIPWEHLQKSPYDFNSLHRYNAGPVMLQPDIARPETVIQVPSRGLVGPVRQLLSQLYTSLSVGRRDRAANIVQRLTEECGSDSREAILAHNVYLDDLFKSLASHGRDSPKSQEMLKEMSRWFEVEIHSKGVSFDARMLITVIRGTIRSLTGSRRERSIRRYVDLSRQLGEDGMEDVLESEEYDDNEYVVLRQATEEYQEKAERQQMAESFDVEPMDGSTETATGTDVMPEVRETGQKGTGLSGIKRTMEAFRALQSQSAKASPDSQRKLAEARQKALEETSNDVAIDRWRKADDELRKIGIHTSLQSKPVAALMWQWYQALLPALDKELAEVEQVLANPTHWNARAHSDRHEYGPYLELLPIRTVAATTILHIMSRLAAGKNRSTRSYEVQDMKLGQLSTSLGAALHEECTVEHAAKSKRRPKSKAASRKPKRKPELDGGSTAATKTGKKKESNESLLAQMEWPGPTRVKLGAMLIAKLLETAQLPVTKVHPRTKEHITQMQPAFLHRVKYQRGRRSGVIVANPALIEKIQSEPVGSLLAKRMPMVVEPRPWKGWSDGGFMYYPANILRLPKGDKSGKDYFQAADSNNELDTVYRGLTALGKVPWKVNQDVFKVQLEAWNSGEAIANFAPLNPGYHHPPEPNSLADPNDRRRWLMQVQEIENKRAGLHSKRCFQNFQMEVARAMLNETLYFPHNMDFRGRAYPIPPYLNHMGADNVRGLLTFGVGKPLGETGLRWLKIHLATVAGHDKASIEERVEFTEAHLDDIYDSVRNPLDGRRWWLQAEDAWQLLAACFELTKALDSPDPHSFVSHLPVQQDGTCNGLQHYAALGGDKVGAAQVNLEPSDRPADVYTAVAEAVKEEVKTDAEQGNAIAQKLHGRITRKCVKQPVMTNVYGVTFYGARLQVEKQLEVLFPEVQKTDAVNLGKMAHYVAVKIFKSLGTMFSGAQAIQTWLSKCADRISTALTPEQIEELKKEAESVKKTPLKSKAKSKKDKEAKEDQDAEVPKTPTEAPAKAPGTRDSAQFTAMKALFRTTVVWTTPLRLPVVQPYRTSKARIVSTSMQNISLVEPQVWDPVSKRKQLQAFPPNFIHSLDATHMLLSALKCTENGMHFASVHDSFWTHACDVNRMGVVLRDAFVAMHEEDVVSRLREEFQTRYQGYMYLASVFAHSPVGKKVLAQRARMKQDSARRSELMIEEERIRLVKSEDPEERAKGEAMVTPGSIVASEADETAFAIPNEFQGQKLGEMPGSKGKVEATSADADADADFGYHDSSIDEGNGPGLSESFIEDVSDAESAKASEAEMEASERDNSVEVGGGETREAAQTSTAAKKPARQARKLYVWLPLTFPEVPKKGEFDVKRLRESRYFFH
ncbi:DNA-directed RNA polymerase, mitochondrial [Lecanosticta acicola]|uniref:DNA-directed RNA polymerase n=1 Tax=Lecanosticta acicola TaxID=111012 RepID=A0AAI9E8H8_9PEZI|nr:DNA-directed RNA polymerase, mitochondrial [Lecanosticta acicola]